MRAGQQPLERKEQKNDGAAPAGEELPQQQQSSAPPSDPIDKLPKPKHDADKEAIQKLVEHTQSTHAKAVTNSVGNALLKLRKRYLRDVPIDKLYDNCIKDLEAEAKANQEKDPELKSAIDYVIGLTKKESDFDKVTLDLPNDEKVEHIFRMKEVLTLVWEALRTGEGFEQHYEGSDEQKREKALDDRGMRLETFYNCLKSLDIAHVCHHGNRNELVLVLNKIHIDVKVIEDARSTVVTFLKDKINEAFKKRYQEEKEDKKKIKELLFDWMIEGNATHILDYVDPRKKIQKRLAKRFINNGISPKCVLNDGTSLETMMKRALERLSFSCDPIADELFYHINKVLNFESQYIFTDKSFPIRSKAIEWVESWIKNTLDMSSKEHLEKLKTFSRIIDLHRDFYRNEFILELSGEMDSVKAIITAFEEYFEEVAKNGFPKELKITDDQIKFLHKKIVSAKEDKLQDKIQNFFSLWFAASKYSKARKSLYEILLNQESREKIKLTDSDISNYKKQYKAEGGLTDITPYMINRVFLHAILVSPIHWSKEFEVLFEDVFDYVVRKFNQDAAWKGEALIRDSYRDELMKQLRYFKIERKNQRRREENEGEEKNELPKFEFILPEQIKSAADWTHVSCLLSPSRREQEYQTFSVLIDSKIIKDIKDVDDTNKIRELVIACMTIPLKYFPAFLVKCKKADIDAIKLVKTPTDLLVILRSYVTANGIFLEGFTSALKMLNIDVSKIITTIDLLNEVLNFVMPPGRFNLFKALDFNVNGLIRSADDLVKVLNNIPRDKAISFFREAHLNLKLIVKSANDFSRIMLMIPPQERDAFIVENAESVDFKSIILTKEDLCKTVLFNLLAENRIPFINKFGINVKTFVSNFGDLTHVLYGIPKASRFQFTKDSKIEFKQLVLLDVNDLYCALAMLPKSTWGTLLEGVDLKIHQPAEEKSELDMITKAVKTFSDTFPLDQDKVIDDFDGVRTNALLAEISNFCIIRRFITASTENLIVVLQMLPQEKRVSFIKEMGIKLGTIVKGDSFDLAKVLNLLPADDRVAVISTSGLYIKIMLEKNAFALERVLREIPEKSRTPFLQTYKVEVKNVVSNVNQLVTVLKMVPEAEKANFVIAFGIDLPSCLKTIDDFLNLMDDLLDGNRMSFLKQTALDVNPIIVTSDYLCHALDKFPIKDRLAFLEYYRNEVKNAISSLSELYSVLQKLPKEHQLIFLKSHFSTMMVVDLDAKEEKHADFAPSNFIIAEIASLLSAIPIEERMKEIKPFIPFLKAMIEHGGDLGNIVELLKEENRLPFIETMQVNAKIFKTADSLIATLKHLEKADRKSFVKKLGIDIEKLKCTPSEKRNLDLLLPLFGGIFTPAPNAPLKQSALPKANQQQRSEQKK